MGIRSRRLLHNIFDGRGSGSEHKRGESERFYSLAATLCAIHPFKRLSISVGRTPILHVRDAHYLDTDWHFSFDRSMFERLVKVTCNFLYCI